MCNIQEPEWEVTSWSDIGNKSNEGSSQGASNNWIYQWIVHKVYPQQLVGLQVTHFL
jgi:hypothetical protein